MEDEEMESAAAFMLSSGPREYACARRFRHRLVLSYLSQEGFHPAFQLLVRQTDAYLCVEHLRRLVAGGLWGEALDYLARFLPPSSGAGAGYDTKVEARPILLFLHALWAFSNVAASVRDPDGTVTLDTHRHDFNVCLFISRSFKLRGLLNLILHSPLSANLDWGVIRNKAASLACDLARESPELSRLMVLPSEPVAPHVPICPSGTRYVKRPPGRPPPQAIAKLYLSKRRSLPSSSPQPVAGAENTESLNKVANLIMECFKLILPSSGKQDDLGAPFLKTEISSLTDPATNIGTSSVPNAGAPVLRPAKTSGILSATDEDTINTFQGLAMTMYPRTELSTAQEEPDMKRQRTCV